MLLHLYSILLGYFNLNFAKKNDINYLHVKYLDDFDDVLCHSSLFFAFSPAPFVSILSPKYQTRS